MKYKKLSRASLSLTTILAASTVLSTLIAVTSVGIAFNNVQTLRTSRDSALAQVVQLQKDNADLKVKNDKLTATAFQPADDRSAWTNDNLLIRFNEARLAAGLKQLSIDQNLAKYAQADLQGNCPNISHDPFRKLTLTTAFNRYIQVDELLSAGYDTPKLAVAGLLASPTHRDGVLDPSLKYIGIGLLSTPANCVSFIIGK